MTTSNDKEQPGTDRVSGRWREKLNAARSPAPREGRTRRCDSEVADNPLYGLWGPDPDAWVDEIRQQWLHRQRS